MMTLLKQIEADPGWIPHAIDPSGRRIQFVRFERSALDRHAFLAPIAGQASTWLALDDVMAMQPHTAPVGFLFHSGFCRSTLLLRALAIPGLTVTLNEPEVLNSMARIEDLDPALVAQLINLLSRPYANGETILIKPSNFPNRLIPSLMAARPSAPAIVLTNTLEEFLHAVVRKGMLGRQWGRQAYLMAATYAAESDGYSALVPGLTDLQVSGLGWLFMQNWFSKCANGRDAGRIRSLRSEVLDRERARAVKASAAHFGLPLTGQMVEEIVRGSAFALDAKTGRNFNSKSADDERASRSAVTNQEIAEVCGWIAEIARASSIEAPLGQTLF